MLKLNVEFSFLLLMFIVFFIYFIFYFFYFIKSAGHSVSCHRGSMVTNQKLSIVQQPVLAICLLGLFVIWWVNYKWDYVLRLISEWSSH